MTYNTNIIIGEQLFIEKRFDMSALSIYIINYILQEIRTKKHSTFFDLHNTLPHDEFSLAGLLAYTFTQIEEDLLNVKDVLIREGHGTEYFGGKR